MNDFTVSAFLSHCVLVLNRSMFSAFLCVSAVNLYSHFAAAAISRVSAALADRSAKSAGIKCTFGGSLPHIRLPFRRE
jgi:hypothetical protein